MNFETPWPIPRLRPLSLYEMIAASRPARRLRGSITGGAASKGTFIKKTNLQETLKKLDF
ncbi:unnamed protein product [Prunus brigantina]